MSWKKHFTPVKTGDNQGGSYSPFTSRGNGNMAGPARSNYSSYLPDVYVGSPNRVERYGQSVSYTHLTLPTKRIV